MKKFNFLKIIPLLFTFVFLAFYFKSSLAAENPIPEEFVYPGAKLAVGDVWYEFCKNGEKILNICIEKPGVYHDGEIPVNKYNPVYHKGQAQVFSLEESDRVTASYFAFTEFDWNEIVNWYKTTLPALGFFNSGLFPEDSPSGQKWLFFCRVDKKCPKGELPPLEISISRLITGSGEQEKNYGSWIRITVRNPKENLLGFKPSTFSDQEANKLTPPTSPKSKNQPTTSDTGYQWQPPGLVNVIADIIGNFLKKVVGIFR